MLECQTCAVAVHACHAAWLLQCAGYDACGMTHLILVCSLALLTSGSPPVLLEAQSPEGLYQQNTAPAKIRQDAVVSTDGGTKSYRPQLHVLHVTKRLLHLAQVLGQIS